MIDADSTRRAPKRSKNRCVETAQYVSLQYTNPRLDSLHLWHIYQHLPRKSGSFVGQLYQAWVGMAGLIDGGLGALKKVGEERQTEHFAGVDDQFQQDADSGGRSIDFSGGFLDFR